MLLFYAAHAAQYRLEHGEVPEDYWDTFADTGRSGFELWNPIDRDIDAFCLLSDLKISLHFSFTANTVCAHLGPEHHCVQGLAGDRSAQIRLAIVRCAADLGRALFH